MQEYQRENRNRNLMVTSKSTASREFSALIGLARTWTCSLVFEDTAKGIDDSVGTSCDLCTNRVPVSSRPSPSSSGCRTCQRQYCRRTTGSQQGRDRLCTLLSIFCTTWPITTGTYIGFNSARDDFESSTGTSSYTFQTLITLPIILYLASVLSVTSTPCWEHDHPTKINGSVEYAAQAQRSFRNSSLLTARLCISPRKWKQEKLFLVAGSY